MFVRAVCCGDCDACTVVLCCMCVCCEGARVTVVLVCGPSEVWFAVSACMSGTRGSGVFV